MSAKAIAWAFECRGLTPVTRNVLFVLADSADKYGKCWPSVGTIARCAEVSERSVQYAVKELEAIGVHRARREDPTGRTTSTMYQLPPPACVFQCDESDLESEGGRVQTVQGEGANGAGGRVHAAAPLNMLEPTTGRKPTTGDLLPEDQRQPQPGNGKHHDKVTTPPEALPACVPADLWADFIADRKERKKPLTTRAQKLALTRLELLHAAGQDVAEVIRQSIERGWSGLFPIKAEPAPGPDRSWITRSMQ